MNDIESVFQILFCKGAAKGSILGPILLNIFINDLFLFNKVLNVKIWQMIMQDI